MGDIHPETQERAINGLRIVLAALFTLAFGLAVALAAGAAYAAYRMPQLEGLGQRVMARLRAEKEPYVPLSKIAPTLPQALIETEDRSFYHNIGVSFEGIARSLMVDLASGRFVEGGSTITQQLVRDQLLTLQKSIPRKLEEMVLAIALTRIDPKPEILTLYLNELYFGHGASGVAAASRIYFGETPGELTPAQSTLLAGLPQAPSLYDPLRNPAAARRRQEEVVAAMELGGSLTKAEGNAILAAPWNLR